MKKIAFYAPIKPPDHHIPSGDRLIAGNLMQIFDLAGHQAELASRYICYSKRSNPEIMAERRDGALAEAERIIQDLKSQERHQWPDLWITYHPYCKAPDWIGHRVTSELSIPYITVEAAKTGQGENGEWLPWREEALKGIRAADLHLCFKPTDRDYLVEVLGDDEKIAQFPTFVDTHENVASGTAELPDQWDERVPVIVTAGMMRKGKKDKNFYILADVLGEILQEQWNLLVIGGGPEEETIKSAYSDIPKERIHWTGQVEHGEVLNWMKSGDVFAWPGWKEPIGMVFLEAQLQGLPCAAWRSMGVPMVVEDGVTGLLSPEDDVAALAANLASLLRNPGDRKKMGKAAAAKVRNGHSLEAAAERFNEILIACFA